jgi:hypothetical protein
MVILAKTRSEPQNKSREIEGGFGSMVCSLKYLRVEQSHRSGA